jgi:hypothetical protein
MLAHFSGRANNARTWLVGVKIFAPVLLLSVLALVVMYHFIQPAPPRHIVFATGSEGGAHFLCGIRYQALLAREAIEVPSADVDVRISENFAGQG